MLGRTLLFSGGTTDVSFAADYLEGQSFDTVVCADSGLDAAFRLNMPVDYFMGDFDSVSPEILERYRSHSGTDSSWAEWIQYPKEKDATDTHMVIDWIVEKGAEEIVILGATGGRLDHFLANLNLLLIPLKRDIQACIIDPQNKIYLIDRNLVIKRKDVFGTYISLQPLTSEVTGITLRGFCYPLEDFTMTIGSSRGISNELAEGVAEAEVRMREGVLVVIESRDEQTNRNEAVKEGFAGKEGKHGI